VSLALIAVLPWLLYAPSLKGGFLWGDVDDLALTPEQLGWGGLWRVWTDPLYRQQFYPVTHTVFWALGHLLGDRPAGYRAAVLALHVATALLLTLTLRRLRVGGALGVGLVFAVHPLHAGTVAWVSKLTTTLSSSLMLGSALLLLPLLPLESDAVPPLQRRRYGAALALFVLAMGAKTAVAPLPVVLALLVWWRQGAVPAAVWRRLAPLFVIAAVLGLFTSAVEKDHYHLVGPPFDWGLVDSVLIAGQAVCFYLAKLAWPAGLSFVYPRWTISAADGAQWAQVAAMVGLPVLLWARRGTLGRGPLTAALAGGALLFPALGFFKVWYMRHSFVADHWAYLGSMALLPLGFAAVDGLLLADLRKHGTTAPVGEALVGVATAALSVLTLLRTPLFVSEAVVWADAYRVAPDSEMVVKNLGWEWVKQGRFRDAGALFARAAQAHPLDAQIQLDESFCLMKLDHYTEAIYLLGLARAQPSADAVTLQQIDALLAVARRLEHATPEERQQALGESLAQP
jgi:hypothetical protein